MVSHLQLHPFSLPQAVGYNSKDDRHELVLERLLSFLHCLPSSTDGSASAIFAENILAANTIRLFSTVFSFKIKYGTLVSNFIHKDVITALNYSKGRLSMQQRQQNLDTCVSSAFRPLLQRNINLFSP